MAKKHGVVNSICFVSIVIVKFIILVLYNHHGVTNDVWIPTSFWNKLQNYNGLLMKYTIHGQQEYNDIMRFFCNSLVDLIMPNLYFSYYI